MTDEAILTEARGADFVGLQSVNWYPDSWKRAIASLDPTQALTQAIDALPGVAGSAPRERASLSRQDVLARFANGAPIDGYLAAIIWGCGTGARNRSRMLKVFRDNDRVIDRIDSMVGAFRKADPETAWSSILGGHRLKWLGIAFGTKVAYFAALASRGADDRDLPLIADANVAKALGEPVTTDVTTYIAYCNRARLLADALTGERSRADQVEYALFRLGRNS